MNRQLNFSLICLWLIMLAGMACTPSIAEQPAATSALASTSLAVSTPMLTQTLTPTLTPTPPPTPAARPIPMETWSAPSPDGQWLAQGLMEGPFLAEDGSEKYHTRLEVVSTTGNISWTLVDKTSNFGLGYTVPKPFEWSSNGRYLYFTHEGVPDGCALFTNGSDLYRGDLTNGQVTEIVSPWVWGISLSPDEKTVATIAWDGEVLELAARDLATGDERRTGLEPKYSQAGGIIWSPDGKTIMLTLATNPCDPARWVQSIARVDLATLTPTILIPDDRRLFTTVEWPETNKVLLTDQAGDLWAMVPMTGELEKIAN